MEAIRDPRKASKFLNSMIRRTLDRMPRSKPTWEDNYPVSEFQTSTELAYGEINLSESTTVEHARRVTRSRVVRDPSRRIHTSHSTEGTPKVVDALCGTTSLPLSGSVSCQD